MSLNYGNNERVTKTTTTTTTTTTTPAAPPRYTVKYRVLILNLLQRYDRTGYFFGYEHEYMDSTLDDDSVLRLTNMTLTGNGDYSGFTIDVKLVIHNASTDARSTVTIDTINMDDLAGIHYSGNLHYYNISRSYKLSEVIPGFVADEIRFMVPAFRGSKDNGERVTFTFVLDGPM